MRLLGELHRGGIERGEAADDGAIPPAPGLERSAPARHVPPAAGEAAPSGPEILLETSDVFSGAEPATVIGAVVRDAKGRRIGRVDDLVLDADGRVEAVILLTDGFLGVWKRRIRLSAEAFGNRPGPEGLKCEDLLESDLKDMPTYRPSAGDRLYSIGPETS